MVRIAQRLVAYLILSSNQNIPLIVKSTSVTKTHAQIGAPTAAAKIIAFCIDTVSIVVNSSFVVDGLSIQY